MPNFRLNLDSVQWWYQKKPTNVINLGNITLVFVYAYFTLFVAARSSILGGVLVVSVQLKWHNFER